MLFRSAGSGPEKRALEALAATLGVAAAVTFTGRLEREAVAALYRDADVALNPSTVDNMPNSLLEALASGVPIVSTNVGGVPHIVQDGTTALLVPPRDPEAMARAALRLLENPELSELHRHARCVKPKVSACRGIVDVVLGVSTGHARYRSAQRRGATASPV